MSTESETNVEVVLATALTNDSNLEAKTLLSAIAGYGYSVYSIEIVSYVSDTQSVQGKIYIFTSYDE